MNIRTSQQEDWAILDRIHSKYYDNEFSSPFRDEKRKIISNFVVEDDDKKIITWGGLELLSEVVAVTDKSFDPKIRREALYKIFQALLFAAEIHKFDQIHCTIIDDPNWERHLTKVGWNKCKGNFLFHKVQL